MIDVVELLMGSPENLLTNRLVAANGQPCLPWLLSPNSFCIIKNQAGWPADLNTFDQNLIYQSVTEVDDPAGYSNPNWWRQFVKPIPWMPRFFTPGGPAWVQVVPDTSYVEYKNGVAQPEQNVGMAVVTFEGPFTGVNFGGIVGSMPYYLHSYRYNPGLAALEQTFIVPGLSVVQWQISQNGAAPSQVVTFNESQEGPMPTLAWRGQ